MTEQDPFFDPTPEQPFELPENFAQKGDIFDIRQKIPTLKEIVIGAGWDHKIFEENPLDLDLSCFLLNRADQTREDEDFIFYNNESACAGAVRHRGDSRTGAGDGDDEQIVMELDGIPFDVIKIAITLSIYEAEIRNQDFSMVRNLYLRVVNAEDDNEVFRYKLPEEEFKGVICIKVGELIREGPKWLFHAQGEPVPGGLREIATQYGLIIQM
jgi:tellurium resistance protein TerD